MWPGRRSNRMVPDDAKALRPDQTHPFLSAAGPVSVFAAKRVPPSPLPISSGTGPVLSLVKR